MANKMLIDASHPEETRVVVLRGNRVEEFDFEAADKKQLRGNIYLAKVTRVEPSLQAAFVDYGGNRHGFLAFSEIHPDYYQIPVSDRQALLEEEARAHRDEDDEEVRGQRRSRRHNRRDRNGHRAEKRRAPDDATLTGGDEAEVRAIDDGQQPYGDDPSAVAALHEADHTPSDHPAEPIAAAISDEGASVHEPHPPASSSSDAGGDSEPAHAEIPPVDAAVEPQVAADAHEPPGTPHFPTEAAPEDDRQGEADEGEDEAEHVEQLGGDAMEEMPVRMHRVRKQYKIQEVIKRRQVLLVQVVKEERGNKGAALTTYLSLAGRYSVLMPNTARGGGISRKITDSGDRLRLKSIAQELEVPEGMGVILRTAGASRTKAEVKRDFEYLLRMWETVRETTLKSTAPTLTYEEGSLVKRAIRDLYNKDIDEVTVAGDEGYREAKEFMRLLMPSHAKNVQPYRDPQPIFAKSGAEAQLDAMFSNQVTLKSGGYIVINQTEALVAIDVNSGRSTREHDIEDTALRTNLEAADEVARQLRLRDLAGLIVVDFIDMEENRNNRSVERRLKDALKSDRARIQVGRISHFGLLEMSRQRIRTGVLEGSTVLCPHCAGAGTVRSTSSIALHILRVLEDALIKSASHDISVRTRIVVALYILNQKRTHLRDLEARFGVIITVAADDSLTGTSYHVIERGEPASGIPAAPVATAVPLHIAHDDEEEIEDPESEAEDEAPTAAAGEDPEARDGDADTEAGQRRRRRRRRRGRGGDREVSGIAANAPQPSDDGLAVVAEIEGIKPRRAAPEDGPESQAGEGAPRSRRRRSRRGSRGPRDAGAVAVDDGNRPENLAALDFQPEPHFQTPDHAGGTPAQAAPGEVSHAYDTDRSWQGSVETNADAAPAAGTAPLPRDETPMPGPTPSDDHVPYAPRTRPAGDEHAASVPAADEAETDPSRPKRSGWWQRAKASLGG